MGDSGSGRLVTTVLLGLTVTTAAAVGLVWLFNNRTKRRTPNRQVYAQYAQEIVQSLETNASTPLPVSPNNASTFNSASHTNSLKTGGDSGGGGNIVVPAGERDAASVLEAAGKVRREETEEEGGEGEEVGEGRGQGGRSVGEREEDRHVSIDCVIPKDHVAGVIGKKGSTIKQIQKDSNTRIHFNNETLENGDRVCVIRGRADDVAVAEDLIRKFIASQPVTLTKEILVPQMCVGRIIGRQGENIRGIQDLSRAKINVDSGRFESRENDETVYNVVVLRGTAEQIDMAETLILEKVEDERSFRNNIRGQATSRTNRRSTNPPPSALSPPPPKTPPSAPPPRPAPHSLVPNGITQVYVSCVYHPNMFWIQQVGQDSIELDKLGEEMTEFYEREDPGVTEEAGDFQVGDIVAAPFPLDDKMYRGKVIARVDEDRVEVEYVDYGDRRPVSTHQLRSLSPKFLNLKFQAIQASLDLSCPSNKWSDEVITRFCDLSYCAQWKSVTGKVKGFSSHPTPANKPTTVLLELMDEEVNIGEKLVEEGLARPKDEYAPPQSSPPISSASSTPPISTSSGIDSNGSREAS